MKHPWLLSLAVLGFFHLAAGLALEQRELGWAAALYWAGFGVLLGLSLRGATIAHAEKKAADALKADETKNMWLSPLSRKVAWDVSESDPGDTFCFWQGETVRQSWKAQGETWKWIQNTTKDVWPKELEFKDGMRWWKGVAVYQKAEAPSVSAV